MKKVLKILIIAIIILNIAIVSVFALFDTDAFIPSTDWADTGEFAIIGGRIVYVFQRVGTYFAVGVLVFIGIQYMLASPSEKADIKGRAVPYLVGAVMVFAIVNLLQIIYKIAIA